MPGIKILPEILSNKIAAGEVVERPASVVKELIENSLDAKASRIDIDIENGGKALIRISDNGDGMSRDDALLSIERHATGKIFSDQDLFSIKTLGFRGEALPSIASVSRFYMETRDKDSDVGTGLLIEGGKLKKVSQVGVPVGTMISVGRLFHNTPARKKFMKSAGVEMGHIADTVAAISLAWPQIRFRLSHNKKTIKNWPAVANPADRIIDALGKDLSGRLCHIASDPARDISVSGWTSWPEMTRSSARRIFIYINGRLAKDALIRQAILKGYEKRLMKGAFPISVLFLNIPFDQVDVNVHPSKQEVKFADQKQVYEMVAQAVSESLKTVDAPKLKPPLRPRTPPSAPEPEPEPIPTPAPIDAGQASETQAAFGSSPRYPLLRERLYADVLKATPLDMPEKAPEKKSGKTPEKNLEKNPGKHPAPSNASRPPRPESTRPKASRQAHDLPKHPAPPNEPTLKAPPLEDTEPFDAGTFNASSSKTSASKTSAFKERPAPKIEPDPKIDPIQKKPAPKIEPAQKKPAPSQQTPLWEKNRFSDLRIIGQFRDSYILCESVRGMTLIDQHAAHERILFEKLKKNSKKAAPASQNLLVPETIETGYREAKLLEEIIPDLAALGFEVEPFGGNSFVIHAVPALLAASDVKRMIIDIVEKMAQIGFSQGLEKAIDECLILMACHSAIRANQKLPDQQIKDLLRQLDQCENPSHCPHGRPTWIHWPLKTIEKSFKRIV